MNAPRELTIAASIARALLDVAVCRGATRSALLRRAHIDRAALDDADNRIPLSSYVALMRAGQEMCNDPALALHFGESVDPAEVSIAHAMGGATTVVDALQVGNRYAALSVEVEPDGSGNRFSLSRVAGSLWFIDGRANPNAFPELTESSFARMVCTMRRFMGDAPLITAVHVTHAEPSYRAEYDRIFGVPVSFGSSRNALQIDETLMAACAFPSSPRYVTDLLRDHADALLDQLERSRSLRARVEHILIPMLPTGDVTVDAVAAELGVSRQTLFRRLRADGVTFEQVLDELRRRRALHHLVANKASVKQAAYAVGYSDASAFSRAFKRWTGTSPREYASAHGPGAR